MTLSPFDILCIIAGLCLALKGSKKVYKLVGVLLLACMLWTGLLVPTYRTVTRHVHRVVSIVSTPDTYTADDIQLMVVNEATAQGVDPEVALLVSYLETNHRNVTGDHGRSYGPMQVMAQYHIPTGDPSDPRVSVQAGVKVLGEKLDRYNGDITKARLAYVCGSASGCSEGKRARVISRLQVASAAHGISL